MIDVNLNLVVLKFDGKLSHDEWHLQLTFLMKFRSCQAVFEKNEQPKDIQEVNWEQTSKTFYYILKLDELIDHE